ncbi:Hsp70 protein-domain-containing protein [Mycena polygramma]|nr:Hsp70 protein-domain-containing protein [Mycena polygramma]
MIDYPAMPEESNWLVAGVAFLLNLTMYGLRIYPLGLGCGPTVQETPQTPVEWNEAGPIIGIDLGTTYSRVGFVVNDHRVKIFLDPDTNGSMAPGFHPKPSESSPVDGYPFPPLDSPTLQSCLYNSCPSTHTVAASLERLRTMAEDFHGSSISQAVITISTDYTQEERSLIEDAALHAKLSPVHFIDQPAAIALAYGVDRRCAAAECYALILDVGTNTRASVLRVDNGTIKVVASAGDRGGDAFNDLLFTHAAQAYQDATDSKLSVVQRLVLEDQVEMAKIRLSVEEQAVIALPIEAEPWFLLPISWTQFEEIAAQLIENIVAETIDKLLRGTRISADAIEHVILAGGSAHIPALQRHFAEYFSAIIPLSASERQADDAVVYGAALFARRLALGEVPEEDKIYMQHVTAMRFGVEVVGGLFATIIPRNSSLPASVTRRLTIPGKTIRVFTGVGEYTNATEFVGDVALPACMDTTGLKISFELSIYGVLNVTAADSLGCSHSTLLAPRQPSAEEIAHMEETAALAVWTDVLNRMHTIRTWLAHYQPLLTQQLAALPPDHPNRAVRTQIVEHIDNLDAWIVRNMLSASRSDFFDKLGDLAELLTGHVTVGQESTVASHLGIVVASVRLGIPFITSPSDW